MIFVDNGPIKWLKGEVEITINKKAQLQERVKRALLKKNQSTYLKLINLLESTYLKLVNLLEKVFTNSDKAKGF